MNDNDKLVRIIEYKKLKGSIRKPKYATRKLSIGLVSCMLGYALLVSPTSVEANEAGAKAATEVVESRDTDIPAETPAEGDVKKEAENFTAELDKLTVKVGDTSIDYSKAVKNLPEGASIKALEEVDTSKETTRTVKATIDFKDGSTKEVEITVEIKKEVLDNSDKLDGNDIKGLATAVGAGRANPDENKAEEFTEGKAKENWDKKPQDKSRWAVGENQRLVRVGFLDPIKMSDIDYDGVFVDADGNTVIRLVYKERSGAATLVWNRALFNFGELNQYIDYNKSYVAGNTRIDNKNGIYPLTPFNNTNERMFDLGKASYGKTDSRNNIPINLVLKNNMTLKELPKKNYIVQMRLTDKNGERIYAYAPGKSSMDYSTYTKTTSVAIEDNINNTFLKGGKQADGSNATNQQTFFSEFIANPTQYYKDDSQLALIRTQYYGTRTGNEASPTTGGQQIGFTQVFDANLVNFLKEDDKGNVAYVNLKTTSGELSPYATRFGIKRTDINYTDDKKLAYIVIAPKEYQKKGLKKVEIPKHDQYTMLSGFYITTIDYVVDKTKLAKTFNEDKTRKLDYSMMSGWTNPNNDGWTVYEKTYDHDFVAQKGDSFLINTSTMPEGGQIMIKIGDKDQALIRKQQGYYYGHFARNDLGIDKIEQISQDGVFKFTLREGAKIKAGDTIKVYLPYTTDHKAPVNFMEVSNATEHNGGAAELKQQDDGYINMHLYTDLAKGASFKINYTLKNGKDSSLIITKGGLLGGAWTYTDTDRVLHGALNLTTGPTGGNFYINPGKLKPGADIVVEAYDEKGKLVEGKTSAVKYSNIDKIDQYKDLTWTDSSDKLSILSLNKSLYKPY